MICRAMSARRAKRIGAPRRIGRKPRPARPRGRTRRPEDVSDDLASNAGGDLGNVADHSEKGAERRERARDVFEMLACGLAILDALAHAGLVLRELSRD